MLVKEAVGEKAAEDWKASTKGLWVESFFNVTTNQVNEGE